MGRPDRSLAAAGAALVALACASTPEPDPRYRPAATVLEVVAVLRAHIPDDTYRFEPARDFTGRNVYRSSLLRLESMERIHAEALHSGHLDGVIAFSKGRALERLRAFDLAAEEYRIAAALDPELAADALASARICDALHAAAALGVDLGEISAETASVDPEELARTLAAYDERGGRLEALEPEVRGSHCAAVVREEIERTDAARAQYFVALRKALPDGDVRAAAELQRVVVRHRESKNASRHLLALGRLYEDLAVEYVEANPPQGLLFDPARFQELVDAGSRLYETVAERDGRPEKIEASRRLEAFLAFALRVDHDRFTP
jgi:tetratricopeptide (TPR) repeat protein